MKKFEAVHYDTESEHGWEVRPVEDSDPWPVWACLNRESAVVKCAWANSVRYRIRKRVAFSLACIHFVALKIWKGICAQVVIINNIRFAFQGFWHLEVLPKSERFFAERGSEDNEYELVRRKMNRKEYREFLDSMRSKVSP